jgi:hypothetical protein
MNEQDIREFEEMFATNAWRRIVKDAEEAIQHREALALQASSWEEVCFYRGEAAQLGTLVSLEQAVALMKLALLDEED